MSCRTIKRRLHDRAEGALSGRHLRKVERHLEQCPNCRELARGLQLLSRTVARLPREQLPRRDLWPQIRRRIEAIEGRRLPSGSKPRMPFHWRRFHPLPLVAAAVLLLVIGGISLRMFVDANVLTRSQVPVAALLNGLEGDYHLLFAEWTAVLRGVGDRFAPEVRQTIRENLEAAEAAIATTRKAAERNPHDSDLHAMLSAAYRQKAELLEWSARTATLLE